MDLNNLGNLAQEASNLSNNPMAQQVLSNPAISGLVNEAEKFSGMDLNGNGSIGGVSPVADDVQVPVSDQTTQTLEAETTETSQE